MLVLSRKKNEQIVLDLRAYGQGLVHLAVVEIRADKVRFGIAANPSIPVDRLEVFEAKERELLNIKSQEGTDGSDIDISHNNSD